MWPFGISRTITFQGDTYTVSTNLQAFCKRVAAEGHAGLEFDLSDDDRVSKETYAVSGRYMTKSAYKDRHFDKLTICARFLKPLTHFLVPAPCPACGGARGINL